MQAVKVLPKWQITIPKNVREKLKICVGDTMVMEEREGEILLKKGKTIFDYTQSLPDLGIGVDEIREKAAAGVARERK
ncbi:MAG: AbrB/MazE/SpoVT family DNA-binding domain-containing protein [Deltaproteobacteria bacterium]|jgi:AbrB family looped-hinge helix DNA binding protein|nr:AbrB/MazE/SpoVT family DNA-binding domain-containing protein [Deltaproteobacteria bacterium]